MATGIVAAKKFFLINIFFLNKYWNKGNNLVAKCPVRLERTLKAVTIQLGNNILSKRKQVFLKLLLSIKKWQEKFFYFFICPRWLLSVLKWQKKLCMFRLRFRFRVRFIFWFFFSFILIGSLLYSNLALFRADWFQKVLNLDSTFVRAFSNCPIFTVRHLMLRKLFFQPEPFVPSFEPKRSCVGQFCEYTSDVTGIRFYWWLVPI